MRFLLRELIEHFFYFDFCNYVIFIHLYGLSFVKVLSLANEDTEEEATSTNSCFVGEEPCSFFFFFFTYNFALKPFSLYRNLCRKKWRTSYWRPREKRVTWTWPARAAVTPMLSRILMMIMRKVHLARKGESSGPAREIFKCHWSAAGGVKRLLRDWGNREW